MKESWEQLVDMSIVHFMIYPETIAGSGPILETVSQIVNDDFFGMIEISHINDVTVRKQVADMIQTSHVRVAFGAQPAILRQKLDINSEDPSKTKEAIKVLEPQIDEAKEIGARRFTVLSGPDPGSEKRERARGILVDSLIELCGYAKDRGLSVTLETFDRTIEKKSLIGPSDEALEVSKAVRKSFPDFGLMYDMGHAPLLDEDPAKALRLLKDHLVHVHVGNCVKKQGLPAYGDQHPRFGISGGENDVAELVKFLRALIDIGYIPPTPREVSPVIGFELKPTPGEKSETVIANGKRTWKKAWSLI
ncbi:MAG TPA: TIM barrel protein [Candidatus Saccharimonadales bacterium]|nr:TIM barrel protein [Candidatus Saccharimonadales bacterium]